MYKFLILIINLPFIYCELKAQLPIIGSDTIQVLPIAFKDDRSYGIRSFEKFVARYDNRSLFILASRENIDTIVHNWLISNGIANHLIRERMFETGDTVVESKEVEAWMKSFKRGRVSVLSGELTNRLSRFIDQTKPVLLMYNELRFRNRWTNSTKNNINYRIYGVLLKNKEVVRFIWIRHGAKEEKSRKIEQNLYPILLKRLFEM